MKSSAVDYYLDWVFGTKQTFILHFSQEKRMEFAGWIDESFPPDPKWFGGNIASRCRVMEPFSNEV